MFTGLVQHVGRIVALEPTPSGRRLVVDAAGWDHAPEPGASIAVAGVCLTVAGAGPAFDVIEQTLVNTNLGERRPGDPVNLEHAATPATFLGGHVVQGHVDAVARVTEVDRTGGSWRLRVEPPRDLLDFIVPRGSVTLDGISLTVAEIDPSGFTVALIPTTLAETTIGTAAVGTGLNLETDYVAKTVVHWLRRRADAGDPIPITPPRASR